jgi:hypothetical protein
LSNGEKGKYNEVGKNIVIKKKERGEKVVN